MVAYDKGIVHCDIKPDNIFITKDERVKMDFDPTVTTQAKDPTRRHQKSSPIPAP
jgi:serine/threonine protein kinase